MDQFERAIASEYGIWIEFESPEAARLYRAKLYTIRRGIASYESCRLIEHGNQLWIVKS